jgi:predicted permease
VNWERFFRREITDAEQQEELDFYLDVTTQEYVARGMEPAEARAAARKKLGNTTLIREEVYHMNTITLIEGLAGHLRHVFRMIRTQPGFVLTVLLSLACGIGVNTAIFTVVHGVLIQPLPYPQADALLGVYNQFTLHGQVFRDAPLSPGMYAACRESCRAFEHFGVWTSAAATVTGTGEPEHVTTVNSTQGSLPALGVQAALGRWFSPEEDAPGGARTVILSHEYWQRKFGGDPSILGRAIGIDFISHEVIGVMPQGFRFVTQSPDVFLALRFETKRADEFSYHGIARLKSGVSLIQANQDLARVWRDWSAAERMTRMLEELAVLPNARPLKNDVIGDITPVLSVLMGALAVLLLLVCANVANLFIVRARARRQEFAIREALGAGRSRIVREQLAESLTLGLLGGALGLTVAYFGIRLLVASGPAGLPRLHELAIGPSAVLFSILCSLAASLLFGFAAVIQAGFSQRLQNTRGATAGKHHVRTQRLLVVGQIAMALVLLVASGLMLRTLDAIGKVTPGFSRQDEIQMVRISIPDALAKEPAQVARMQKEMLDKFSATPGVTAVGFGSSLPLDGNRNGVVVAVEGKTDPDRMPPNRRYKRASPGLFAAQGSRLLAGRDFTWEDVFNQRHVAIVSENMARETWTEPRAAISKRIRIGRDGPWTEVIGVVENIHADGLHQPAPATVYARVGIEPSGIRRTVTFAIRSPRAGSRAFVKEIATAVHSVSPSVPVAEVRTLGDAYRRSIARTSFTFVLMSIATAMALALALIGIYGILAYAVAERRHEVGIRLALGAEPGVVRSMFVRQGLILASIGGTLGIAAATVLSRWISALLFGVKPLDPLTYIGSVVVLTAAALLASYLPARRAASVDPVEALRGD